MKEQVSFSNLVEVRQEIDRVDKQIIDLLGERFSYVKAASKFKTSQNDVQAPDRFKAMLVQRRVWAEAEGLSPDIIEKMFRDLVQYFIQEEMKEWHNQGGENG